MQAAGIDRFELIDHDACLMSNYEAASALGRWQGAVGLREVTFGAATLSTQAIQALGQNVSGEEWGRTNNEAYGAYATEPPGLGHLHAGLGGRRRQMSRLDAAIQSFADAASRTWPRSRRGRARRSDALEFVRASTPVSARSTWSTSVTSCAPAGRPDDVAVAGTRCSPRSTGPWYAGDPAGHPAGDRAQRLLPEVHDLRAAVCRPPHRPAGWEEFVSSTSRRRGPRPARTTSPRTSPTPGDGPPPGAGRHADRRQLGDGQADNVTGTETQVYTSLGGADALAIDLPGYLNAGGQDQVQGAWSIR